MNCMILYKFYCVIVDKVIFNMLNLEVDYFFLLKCELGEGFCFFGYENKEGELLGFCILIENGIVYDVYFLGLEEIFNKRY